MKRDFSPAAFLPTPQQELLLKVLLCDGPEWQNHWMRWSGSSDIDALDNGSYGLLPLLYRKLQQAGVDYLRLNGLKGAYRKNWVRNHQLFNQAVPAMESLHGAGIPIMLLKGAALTLQVYGDFGLRTMRDIDVLVPTERTRAALAILQEAGWTFIRDKLPDDEDFLNFHHALYFKNANGHELDLHRKSLIHCMAEDADVDFWSSSEPVLVDDIPCRVMNPADQLLHVLAHGAVRNPIPPIRWVADAVWILRRYPDLDWRRLIQQTEKRQLALPLRATLDYLSGIIGAPVPADVRDRLHRMQVSPESRALYELFIRPLSPAYHAKSFRANFQRFREGAGRKSFLRNLAGYGRVLQVYWGLKSLWCVPFAFFGRALRFVMHRPTSLSSSKKR